MTNKNEKDEDQPHAAPEDKKAHSTRVFFEEYGQAIGLILFCGHLYLDLVVGLTLNDLYLVIAGALLVGDKLAGLKK